MLAVPSESPGGLDARISPHFGHCSFFTLVQIGDGTIGEVTILPNEGHEHGGCMAPVMWLKENGVTALVAGGMGMRPLAGFQQQSITVYYKDEADTVREAAELVIGGNARVFGDQHTCGGHEGGSCGGHPDEPTIDPIDGPAEQGCLVHMSYDLQDAKGNPIDSSEVRFILGLGQLPAGLERAVEGHVKGDRFEVEVTPEDGFGVRDDRRRIEMPRSGLPDGVSEGDVVHAQMPRGAMPVTVLSIGDDKVILDANHPLAGKHLRFQVEVLQVFEVS